VTSYLGEAGVTTLRDDTRKTVIRPDSGEVLGVFKTGFRIHDYNEWLITNVENLLDDSSLQIGSAGLLRGGAVAWVQVEVPETIDTPEGVSFRPFLSAATSLDGSLSSTYQTGAQVIVCDNTLSAALGDTASLRIKVKHSVNSLGRLSEVRDALGIVHKVADTFAAEVKALCELSVSDKTWSAFLDLHVELPKEKGRGQTIAITKQDALRRLYRTDERVAPWSGTAFGVLQAVNTFTHHLAPVRGGSRPDRNALRTVTGQIDTLDRTTMETLQKALLATA
jgi:phage/plasmid-like protein (TIGR03299 family)